MAKAFAALPRAPARSILFVATTGEEEGEIGSDYFVHHAPIAIDKVVASLNVDGVSIARFTEVVATGGANSSLGATVEEAARQLGLRVRSESSELGGSDHSPFLRAGIPALWILAELSDEWMRTRHHTPRDDMNQPLDVDAAVRYTELEFLTGYLVAQNPRRPWWNKGEFFSSARP